MSVFHALIQNLTISWRLRCNRKRLIQVSSEENCATGPASERSLAPPSFSFSFRENKFRIIQKSQFRTRMIKGMKFIFFFLFIIIIINQLTKTVIISWSLLIGSFSGYIVCAESFQSQCRSKGKKSLQVIIRPSPREERERLSIRFILITFNWCYVKDGSNYRLGRVSSNGRIYSWQCVVWWHSVKQGFRN